MTIISFFVEGEPRAKQSFRSLGKHGGYIPARVKAWQTDVGWCAQTALRKLEMIEPMEGNLSVELIFFLGNRRKIDLDNLSKAVQDGLNNIAWIDDQQNITLTLKKYICRERQGVLVKIRKDTRAVEITEENMRYMIAMAPYGLEPVWEKLGDGRIYDKVILTGHQWTVKG